MLLVVTLWWKVSAHVAMAACWAVGLGVLSTPWAALVAAPVPVAVAVSRVRTGDHTPAQTVVGALIGVLVALGWASVICAGGTTAPATREMDSSTSMAGK